MDWFDEQTEERQRRTAGRWENPFCVSRTRSRGNGMNCGKWTLVLFMCVVLFALSACASEQNAPSESPVENTVDFSAVMTRDIDSAVQIARLGSSPYTLRLSREFSPMSVSNEDWEDDMVACYHNGSIFLDFAVYQFSKEGYPDTLAEFVEQEAEEYEASEIATDEVVNGIPVGYYRSMANYGGVYRDGLTYVFENGDEYIEIDFWLIGYQAEQEMWRIINTLTVIESEPIPLGEYQIQIPENLLLISGKDANPAVYGSEIASVRLYISRFPSDEISLDEFVRTKAGSNVETDTEINGVPIVSYCAIEAIDGAFHSTLSCILDDGGGFTALTFRLDGITAEEEAEAILDTLSKRP